MKNEIATYATRAAARAIIAKLDAATYVLSHGEYERPDYKVRKVRGENSFYIHATRYFYAGTFCATPSGALSVNSNELYHL